MSNPLKITWINPARIERQGASLTSHRVCIRVRCIIPARELSRRGHDVTSVSIFDWQQWADNAAFYNRDLFVLGKAFIDTAPIVPRILENGGKLIVDLCDNVFEPPEDALKRNYEAILPLADGVVTSSDALRDVIARRLQRSVPIMTVPDAVEEKRTTPHFAPARDKLKLLWFGYPNNLPLMHRELPALSLLARVIPLELRLVTAVDDAVRQAFEGNPYGARCRVADWSPDVLAEELAHCDMVLIPSDDSPARVTKSANRLITSLWAGRYAVAYPLPSYGAFTPFAGIGKDLTAGILWALENQDAVVQRIAAGQQFIAAQYADSLIADAWLSFAEQILA